MTGPSSLPLDSDLEVAERRRRARPVHVHPGYLAIVAVGGAIGTFTRLSLSILVPKVDSVPVITAGINITGAFLLGLLLEGLARGGPDAGARRTARLLLGTGLLGGYTTYSSLATDTVLLLQSSAPLAVLYAVGTLLGGAVTTWLGILAGAALPPPRGDAA